MSTTTNPSRYNRLSEPNHPTCLDIKGDSSCNATTKVINILTGVTSEEYVYKQSFVIRSKPEENKHSILCLISNGDTTEIREAKPINYLPFTVNFGDVLFGELHVKNGDKLGIIVFNDLPNDFQLCYLDAIRNNYDSIFLFDAPVPDVDGKKLNDVIKDYQKLKGMDAPKEGQGGVIISGG